MRLRGAERFWSLVSKPADPYGCWMFTGTIDNKGYGRMRLGGTRPRAHQISYALAGRVVPQGLMLDHLCRNRACVNPDHLEPVTSRENTMRSPVALAAVNARMDTCRQGHPFDAANTRLERGPRGLPKRRCVTCLHERMRRANWYRPRSVAP